MSLPFSFRVGDLNAQFFDDDGVPLAGGFVHTLEAGTSDEKDTYADADTVSPTVNQNPVPLDSAGRCTMFLEAGAYDFEIMDSNSVVLRVVSGVEDIGLTFLTTLGQQMAEGSRDVTSGYTVLATDNTITVDSDSGPNPAIINLPPVADRGQDVVTINLGAIPIALTPNGSETINFVAAAYDISASASPTLSSVTLRPDGSSNWLVIGEVIA